MSVANHATDAQAPIVHHATNQCRACSTSALAVADRRTRKGKRMTRTEQRIGIGTLLALIVFTINIATMTDSQAWDDGSTFGDGGVCWDADGVEGLSTAWGECVTPNVYDERFSIDNLATIEDPTQPGRTIAETSGLTDTTPPSDRDRRFAGVELLTFRQAITYAHNGTVAL